MVAYVYVPMLSGQSLISNSPLVEHILRHQLFASFRALFVDEDSAADSSIDRVGVAVQLRALSLVLDRVEYMLLTSPHYSSGYRFADEWILAEKKS